MAGVGTAFLMNAVSFVGVIVVIALWKRHPRKRPAPPETLAGATVAAIRYVRYSPGLRTLMVRSGIVLFFASGLLALLPLIAHFVSENPMGYGLLLGCFGVGAVLGALIMQQVRARWPAEAVVSGRRIALWALHAGGFGVSPDAVFSCKHADWRRGVDPVRFSF
jgi:predicted MFS family arabinose efflux permease